jgi:hypothetical protein
MERVVVVHPGPYGTDNSCSVDPYRFAESDIPGRPGSHVKTGLAPPHIRSHNLSGAISGAPTDTRQKRGVAAGPISPVVNIFQRNSSLLLSTGQLFALQHSVRGYQVKSL